MNELIIADVGIRQDSQGRYCLNDLHRAAGGENRHRPSLWLQNMQVMALVDEMGKAGIPAIESKQQLGTFVGKELVYAYAMWISPKFHLQVIRAYDAMVSRPLLPQTFAEALQLAADQAKLLEDQRPKVEFFDQAMSSEDLCDMNEVAKILNCGMGRNKLFKFLMEKKVIFYNYNTAMYQPYQSQVDAGRFKLIEIPWEKEQGKYSIYKKVMATQKGVDFIKKLVESA